MCLGVPAKIIEIKDQFGKVDIMGVQREIALGLLDGLAEGDFVLVHAGCAVQKLDDHEAQSILELYSEMMDDDEK